MTDSELIIKVGGSLCDPQVLAPLAAVIRELAETHRVVIIPGGGPFANLVRDWDQRLRLSETASHWMAVAAMNQYGLLLESQGFGTAVDDPAMLASIRRPAIFLPYGFLRSTDPLPHSWSLTSDSIAAYLAPVLRIRQLVLLKAIDPPISSYPIVKAAEEKVVDPCFGRYLTDDTECWVVNGKHPRGLLQFHNFGTRLIADPPAFSMER